MSAKKPPNPTLERIGVNAVEAIFLNDFDWLFREQRVSDYGIDAQVEIVEHDKPTGKLLALQIKTGPLISGSAVRITFSTARGDILTIGHVIPCQFF